MSANDRKRASNFSDEEINLVLELMETKWMCIEDKKTDTKTMEKKEAAWNSIMNDYKARISGNRDLDNIKNLWKRLKQDSKKKNAAAKRNARKTGGGTSSSGQLSPKSERVLSMLPIEQIEPPLASEYDSDALRAVPGEVR